MHFPLMFSIFIVEKSAVDILYSIEWVHIVISSFFNLQLSYTHNVIQMLLLIVLKQENISLHTATGACYGCMAIITNSACKRFS